MIEILFGQSGDPLRAAALKDSEDVLCLPFLLDTGALQGGIGSPDRAAVLAMSLGQNGQSSDPKADLLAPLLTELKRLETYLGRARLSGSGTATHLILCAACIISAVFC